MRIRTSPILDGSGQPITIDRCERTYTSLGYRSTTIANSEGRSYSRYPGSTYDDRDRRKLIDQSRDFMRNNAIYKGMIERAVNYIVGNGFTPQVTARSKTQVSKIEGLWQNWQQRPEIRNLLSGRKVARMVLREILAAGDTIVLKTSKGLIQHFEAEQLDGGAKRDGYEAGIKKDVYGRPEKFRLCPWKDYGVKLQSGKDYDAGDILFLADPERPSQSRGVPVCQAAFPMLHRINDVCDSEAIAWQLLARLAVSITRKEGPTAAYVESRDDTDKTSTEKEGDLARRISEFDYALLFHGEPGDEIRGIERNIPGLNFSESLRTFLRLLGLPLGMPLEIIFLDWTQSNYSQSRAVLEQAYENFVGWQAELIDGYYQPLFDWKLAQWRDEDNSGISSSGDVTVSWRTPTFPWIDQLKEAQAYGEQLDRGLVTHTEVCKSRHSDRDEIIALREREVREAIETAQKLSADTGEKVPWQIFAGLKPAKTEVSKTETAQNESGEQKETSDDNS